MGKNSLQRDKCMTPLRGKDLPTQKSGGKRFLKD